jgi:hypothetical protein
MSVGFGVTFIGLSTLRYIEQTTFLKKNLCETLTQKPFCWKDNSSQKKISFLQCVQILF